ncbi:peptidoglycan -binding protein [Sneathiella chinensis]|uniref:Flagellar motor protein MotB n=1 Tax=Sneathiella chinensis TaxID=349750 RepID=A0ABQ5U3A2_9PROT|nr:peptidoglycan -binding protein [Sneathiella chinensis]GLQ06308.1 flagellar motor protein MotB [Sneathiella chinensis]
MARRNSAKRANYEIWPGFVDALTTLLLVIIFLLVVFVLAQFFLSQALSGRDAALEKLNQQVNELADLLALERQSNAELSQELTELTITLRQSNEERDSAIIQLDTLTARAQQAEQERDELVLLLREQEGKTAEAEARIKTSQDEIAVNLKEIESLKRDIESLQKVREELEKEVGALADALEKKDQEIGAIRDRSKELEATLAEEQDRTRLAQKDVEDRDIKLAELQALYLQTQDSLTEEEKISAEANKQVSLLNAQINALRQQLARIEEALEVAEAKDKEQKAQIADLGRRLNQALAQKVQELQQYRSNFFGELRKVLKDRPGISVVGDRFVFQSEVLFGLGEAELGQEGRENMAAFAKTLLEISKSIPDDIDWVLRVDGHTDKQPIKTARFPSNWELSTARALSVTKYLINRGVPPDRLAPTGFGEFRPLDPRDDEIAYLRNRRIELKLTER